MISEECHQALTFIFYDIIPLDDTANYKILKKYTITFQVKVCDAKKKNDVILNKQNLKLISLYSKELKCKKE